MINAFDAEGAIRRQPPQQQPQQQPSSSSSHYPQSSSYTTVQVQGRSLLVPRTAKPLVMGNESSKMPEDHSHNSRPEQTSSSQQRHGVIHDQNGRPLSNLSVLMQQQEQAAAATATTHPPMHHSTTDSHSAARMLEPRPPTTITIGGVRHGSIDEADSACGRPRRHGLGSSAPMNSSSAVGTGTRTTETLPLEIPRHLSMGAFRGGDKARRYEWNGIHE